MGRGIDQDIDGGAQQRDAHAFRRQRSGDGFSDASAASHDHDALFVESQSHPNVSVMGHMDCRAGTTAERERGCRRIQHRASPLPQCPEKFRRTVDAMRALPACLGCRMRCQRIVFGPRCMSRTQASKTFKR
jgi:hypothetical protein